MYQIDLDIANFLDNEFQEFIKSNLEILKVQALGFSPSGHTEFRFIGEKAILLEFLEEFYNENEEFFNTNAWKIV